MSRAMFQPEPAGVVVARSRRRPESATTHGAVGDAAQRIDVEQVVPLADFHPYHLDGMKHGVHSAPS